MKPDYTRALILAGQLSDQVRRLVGGREPLIGQMIPAATFEEQE